MEFTISRETRFTASQLPDEVLDRVMRELTFPNPAYQEAEKHGRSTKNIPQRIWGYGFVGDQIIVPRGFTRQLESILRETGIDYRVNDQRRVLPEVDFTFTGQLRDFQAAAVNAFKGHDFGVLEAPTGSGKTVMALALLAQRRQPTLIIVHTKELLMQWVSRIERFLGIPASKIGVIGNGEWRGQKPITVATVQSLLKGLHVAVPHIGFLIVDECHRCPSRTFTEAVTAFDCQYMLGLSATPWRRDGLDRLIWWNLGYLVFQVDQAELQDAGHVLRAEVVWRETDFESRFDASIEYSQMLVDLIRDPQRNDLIVSDIAQEAANGGGICLVLSDRKSHVKEIEYRLSQEGIETAVLVGNMSSGKRRAVVEALESGRVKVLAATTQLIGEGFDFPELSTLFLATPISFEGRLLQCLGRVLRAAPGKDQAKVYDYCDRKVGVLEHSARGRQRVYEDQFETSES